MAERKIINRRIPVDSKRWPGVYKYKLDKHHQGRSDVAYTITFKDPAAGRKVWEKVGKKSEGITPQICAEIRAQRVRKARHGEAVKTAKEIAREKRRTDRTILKIADIYFDSDRGKKLKGRTTDLNRYENHIKPLLGKRLVSSIAPLDIDRIKKAMKAKAPATVANVLELLRRLINYGAKNHLCPPLPFIIELPRKDNELVEYLEPEEAERLVRILDDWKRQDIARMLKLAMVTGARRGEIFKLRRNDLDFHQSLIWLRDPKGDQTVTIPMNGPARKIFQEQLAYLDEKQPKSLFVFPGRAGGQRIDCSAVDRIKEKAQLPENFRIFHGLRHHYGVTLANSGEFSLDMIGELLTHKSTAMTKRYSQFLPGTVKTASEKAAKIIQGQAGNSGSNKQDVKKAKK